MHKPQVKIIGNNGQLSLGKEYAGKMVLVDQTDDGTWFIKAGKFVPDSEAWLYQKDNQAKIDRALQWADENEANNNFNTMIKRMESGGNKD